MQSRVIVSNNETPVNRHLTLRDLYQYRKYGRSPSLRLRLVAREFDLDYKQLLKTLKRLGIWRVYIDRAHPYSISNGALLWGSAYDKPLLSLTVRDLREAGNNSFIQSSSHATNLSAITNTSSLITSSAISANHVSIASLALSAIDLTDSENDTFERTTSIEVMPNTNNDPLGLEELYPNAESISAVNTAHPLRLENLYPNLNAESISVANTADPFGLEDLYPNLNAENIAAANTADPFGLDDLYLNPRLLNIPAVNHDRESTNFTPSVSMVTHSQWGFFSNQSPQVEASTVDNVNLESEKVTGAYSYSVPASLP